MLAYLFYDLGAITDGVSEQWGQESGSSGVKRRGILAQTLGINTTSLSVVVLAGKGGGLGVCGAGDVSHIR